MVKFRLYYDKDKEQDWLMEMVNRGWAVEKFFLGFYFFVPCEPGEYTYQIDLLSSWKNGHMDYKEFLSENNVEIVFQWFFWIVLRKKSSDGEFILYTDNESKIGQYSRIRKMFVICCIIEFICMLIELNSAIQLKDTFFGTMTVLILVLVLVFLRILWVCQNKINELKENK